MTTPRGLLSVRLDPALAEALERHCARTGATRSEVVKQSVAQYIVSHDGPTLGGLADAVMRKVARRGTARLRAARQKRYRDYVREKRRR
jgi:hypothetical protein